jgi:hypothetical protein
LGNKPIRSIVKNGIHTNCTCSYFFATMKNRAHFLLPLINPCYKQTCLMK